MVPENILAAFRELILAGMALIMGLGGAAGAGPARVQIKANVHEAQRVPSLPTDVVLTVAEVEETEVEETDSEETDGEETEEIDEEDLDAPAEVKYIVLRGPITSRPEGVEGTWAIAGRAVEVTAETTVSTRAANAAVGDWAQVQAEGPATEQPEETAEEAEAAPLVARSLAVMSSTNLGRVVGTIESIGEKDATGESVWVVSGVSVTVTGQTHIVGTPEVGRLADVHGAMTVEAAPAEAEGDDAEGETVAEASVVRFVAKLAVVRGTRNLPKEEREREKAQKAEEKARERRALDIGGQIESMAGRTGAWVVAGQTIRVAETTLIDEKKGQAVVGAQVRVRAEQDEDGTLVALEVVVQRAVEREQPEKGGKKDAPAADKPAKDNPGQGRKDH